MEEAEAEVGATKQPTYPKVAVFNLGRAHVWWKRERRSGVRRYLAPDLNGRIGEGKTGDRCSTRARRRGRGDTPVATTEEMRKLDEEADKHSNHLREPLHLDNRHAT